MPHFFRAFFRAVLTPISTFLNAWIRSFVIFIISIYQRCISPIKGFSCAYRVHHKAESCSCYIKQAFLEHDLQTAILLSKNRFRDCAQSAKALTIQQQDSQPILSGGMGRRGALRFFSLFTFGLFSTQAIGGGCPGIQVCCSGFVFGVDEDEDEDEEFDDD